MDPIARRLVLRSRTLRPAVASLLAVAATILVAGCSDGVPPTQPEAPAADGPSLRPAPSIAIDGVFRFDEWRDAASVGFSAAAPEGTVPVRVFFTHDRDYLYLAALVWRTDGFHPFDGVAFEFDNDNDGVAEDGDDIVLSSALPGVFVGGDFYRYTCPTTTGPAGCNQSDVGGGGTLDVLVAFGAQPIGGITMGVFEWRHDLDSADDLHDFSIRPRQTVGVYMQTVFYDVGSDSNVFTHFPGFRVYCALTIAPGNNTSIAC